MRRRVLRHAPKPRIGNADQDHGFNLPLPRKPVGRCMCIPRAARNVGCPPIEEILPILQIEDRKLPLPLLHVLLGQIHEDCPIVGKDLRMELVDVVPGVAGEGIGGSRTHPFAGHSLAYRWLNRSAGRIF